jgi:phospholipid/cholesterol/gamma-HCH transport system permease protein
VARPSKSVEDSFDEFIEWFGELVLFLGRTARAAVRLPFEWREFFRQLDSIGPQSMPLVALAGAATGVVLSLHTRDSLSRFGALSMLPAVITFSLVKETGPIITALVVSGRVGAGIGAELGSMRVTEQIDAMEAQAVDPYKYLAFTRILACVISLPLLTLGADAAGILFGWIATTVRDPVSLQLFLQQGLRTVSFDDFLPSTFKTAVFGLIIGVVASFQGMRTKGGTEGVGRSATSSVVLCSLIILISDVVLVKLIQVIYP